MYSNRSKVEIFQEKYQLLEWKVVLHQHGNLIILDQRCNKSLAILQSDYNHSTFHFWNEFHSLQDLQIYALESVCNISGNWKSHKICWIFLKTGFGWCHALNNEIKNLIFLVGLRLYIRVAWDLALDLVCGLEYIFNKIL